jgi:microcystin-dependent protein
LSDPFVGEIAIFGFNFAPQGWAMCQGQLLPVSQNIALFSLLGNLYGGDGRSNFALPNLQGSAAIGAGQGPGLSSFYLGDSGGEIAIALLPSEMPGHGHGFVASTDGATQQGPAGNLLASAGAPGTPPLPTHEGAAEAGASGKLASIALIQPRRGPA